MSPAIDPVSASQRLSELLGEEEIFAQASAATSAAAPAPAPNPTEWSGNPFEDMLAKAVDSLNSISAAEMQTNQLVEQYVQGKVDIQEVMVAQAKIGVMTQVAVTSVNAAVNTLKEITQIQI